MKRDNEFEKNRQAILKQTKKHGAKKSMDHFGDDLSSKESRKYAWEYEVEMYRQQKRKDRFYLIGAVCGILSLMLNLMANGQFILDLIKGIGK